MALGDKETLALGDGLRIINGTAYLTLTEKILEYFGTSLAALKDKDDELVLQYDKSPKHGNFVGVGVKSH